MHIIEKIPKPIIAADAGRHLIARTFNSGFSASRDNFNSISAASDGHIYYILSSDSVEVGGVMYAYNPLTDETTTLGNLTDFCGEQHMQAIPQGKSHVRFYESKGKLYFSTHVGYYEQIDGMDKLPVNAPTGIALYPGGHILAFDLYTKEITDLAMAPEGEGIVSMTMDSDREQIYGISWPKGNFIHYDIKKNDLKNLGQISGNGENGKPGRDFRSLCRSLFVDPRDGSVYFSTAEGDVCAYRPGSAEIQPLKDVNLRLDYLGKYDPARPGSMGYNWRKIFWYTPEQVAYGVHGNSGYLFRFDPMGEKLELIERITSEPSKKSGMFDQFSYGYLGFQLGPDGETIYYLTGGPIYVNGHRLKGNDEIEKGAAKGLENLHLVTYHLPTNHYQDHGPIFYENGDRPLCVNSIAVGRDGNIYTLARITENGHTRTDLICFPDPLKS
ncbi:MAG: hypothetical protein REI78_04410 [Pedobacter sp.]|nr:hypothetical protein [Pedobacter sp.]MDQ8052242.1 hypothetical protein [Pedobacter sp.]